MNDAKYDDLVGHRVKIDRVRKASHERAACLTVDARVGERRLDDTAEDDVDFRGKGRPQAQDAIPRTSHGRRAALPPLAGGEQDASHAPWRSFRRTSSQGMAEAGSAMC